MGLPDMYVFLNFLFSKGCYNNDVHRRTFCSVITTRVRAATSSGTAAPLSSVTGYRSVLSQTICPLPQAEGQFCHRLFVCYYHKPQVSSVIDNLSIATGRRPVLSQAICLSLSHSRSVLSQAAGEFLLQSADLSVTCYWCGSITICRSVSVTGCRSCSSLASARTVCDLCYRLQIRLFHLLQLEQSATSVTGCRSHYFTGCSQNSLRPLFQAADQTLSLAAARTVCNHCYRLQIRLFHWLQLEQSATSVTGCRSFSFKGCKESDSKSSAAVQSYSN